MVFSFAACSSAKEPKETETQKEEWEDIELPEDEIILVRGYVNYAWGCISTGTFVTGKGDIYHFDVSEAAKENDFDFLGELQKVMENGKPAGQIKTKYLKEMYYYINEMDPDAKMEAKNEACDYGENYISVLIDGKLVTVSIQGDNTGRLDDKYAKKIEKLFDKKFSDKMPTN